MLFSVPTPTWSDTALWQRAFSADLVARVEAESVKLTPEDPRVRFLPNVSTMWFGPRALLHHQAKVVFDHVRRELELDGLSEWLAQKSWFDRAVRTFFPERDECLGGISFVPIRRPAHWRKLEDPTTSVTQDLAHVSFRKLNGGRGQSLDVGDLELPLEGLAFAEPDGTARELRLAQVMVPRTVHSTLHGVQESYHEAWYCMADSRRDGDLLSRGMLPALPSSHYVGTRSRLRANAMVTMVRVSPALLYTMLAIEIDTATGRVLSLRWSRFPARVALLNFSRVDQESTAVALRRLAS